MRALTAGEIEVRVGQVGDGYVTLLLYKNARVDRAMLDEEFGKMNWSCKYSEHKGNLFCSIGVYDPDKKEWVWKEDCGTESQTEKEKGEASDAFKRAGFRWGIGIELYNAPRIYAPVATDKVGDYKYKLHNSRDMSGLFVSYIKTEDGKVTALDIAQKAGRATPKVIWSTDRRKEGMTIE
jgi:hypothetical protein